MKDYIRRTWLRFRTWLLGVLVAIGFIAGVALASPHTFTWTNPTQNVDGTTFDPATELEEIRIYCNISPSAFTPERPGVPASNTPDLISPGDLETATRDFPVGDYTCFGTAFSIYGYESDPSNTTSFTITPTVAPNPPVLQ